MPGRPQPAGDAGTFGGEALEWALLEGYANGANNRAVRAIAAVEDVIVDGDLVGDAAG